MSGRPNIERLYAVLERVERANRELPDGGARWDQENWAAETACGTSYCFAGWAPIVAGVKGEDYARTVDEGRDDDGDPLVEGKTIRNWAQEWLGLSQQQAYELFRASNSLYRLRLLIEGMEKYPKRTPTAPRKSDTIGRRATRSGDGGNRPVRGSLG